MIKELAPDWESEQQTVKYLCFSGYLSVLVSVLFAFDGVVSLDLHSRDKH